MNELRIGKFFVKRNVNGRFEILKREPWYVSDVRDEMWCKVPEFPNAYQAYRFLKANHESLI